MRRALLLVLAWCAASPAAALEVETFALENGMRFLVVERPSAPLVAAGWVVEAGSASEQPGRTGVAHLIEHLLFGGTEVIGTRDFRQERELMAELERLEGRGGKRAAARRRELERQLAAVRLPGEYARIYAEAGAVGVDARTSRDYSVYSMMVPPGRLEVWFWMESDRLLHPVFRDLEHELGVIAEEERQRVASMPLGPVIERWEQVFWGEGHPYSWLSGGRAEDWPRIGRADLRRAFARSYAPSNLTAAIVGPVSVEGVRKLAERYFSRLSVRSEESAPSPAAQRASPPAGPKRLDERCACRRQVELRFRTVPFAHDDAVVLDVLAGLLSGRTGRLHRGLVLGSGLALSAGARHAALRRAGSFSLFAEPRPGVSLEQLSAALAEELERLRRDGVGERELRKVQNQITTDAARQLQRPLSVALRLLTYRGLGDWQRFAGWEPAALAVTATDLRRVLERYFEPGSRFELRVERAD